MNASPRSAGWLPLPPTVTHLVSSRQMEPKRLRLSALTSLLLGCSAADSHTSASIGASEGHIWRDHWAQRFYDWPSRKGGWFRISTAELSASPAEATKKCGPSSVFIFEIV